MSAGTYYLGVLCATYFVSRLAGLLIAALRPSLRKNARTAAVHLMSGAILVVIVLLARALDVGAILPYLVAQAVWWGVDAARTYRPSSRSRMVNPLRWRHTDRVIFGLMMVAGLAYVGVAYIAFTASLYTLGRVPIGQSHADVLYASGKPALIRPSSDAPFASGGNILTSEGWEYKSPPIRVDFDTSTGLSRLAECTQQVRPDQGSCPAVFSIGIGSTDQQLTGRLGGPTAIVSGLGTRVFRYPELGLDFVLEQFAVRTLRAYPADRNILVKAWRFVRFAIP